MSKPQVPEVIWAQRSSETDHEKNVVYLTVRAPDLVSPKITLEAQKLAVSGTDKHGKTYDLQLNLFAEIEPEKSKQRHTDFNLYFILQKKKDQAEYWPRLSSEKGKLHNVRTDFDKWVDEDEQDEAEALPEADGMGGQDFSSMMGGGAGGMQGLDFSKLAGMVSTDRTTTNIQGGEGGQPDFAEMMKGMGGDEKDGEDSDDEMPKLEEVKD